MPHVRVLLGSFVWGVPGKRPQCGFSTFVPSRCSVEDQSRPDPEQYSDFYVSADEIVRRQRAYQNQIRKETLIYLTLKFFPVIWSFEHRFFDEVPRFSTRRGAFQYQDSKGIALVGWTAQAGRSVKGNRGQVQMAPAGTPSNLGVLLRIGGSITARYEVRVEMEYCSDGNKHHTSFHFVSVVACFLSCGRPCKHRDSK